MLRTLCVWLTFAASLAAQPIFRFETDEFWLNLHHFLYVLGRAANQSPDAGRAAVSGAPADASRGLGRLTSKERVHWQDAVRAYAAGLSRKDAVFDAPLPAITTALSRLGDARSIAGLEPAVARTLDSAAPLYRKVWWNTHREANRKWAASTRRQVDRHGRAILAFLTRVYGLPWPDAGFAVHVSSYSNWAGAYSTDGNLLVIASVPPSKELENLEIVFHEAMHQWDEPVQGALREQARLAGVRVPPNLSHALVFFTAGEAARRAVPGHVPYAEANGVWDRGLGRFLPGLRQAWKPYLDGHGSRDEALKALVEITAASSRQ